LSHAISLFSLAQDINNQSIEVRGTFLSDTTELGLPLRYALSVHYPAAIQLIFPDSAYIFAPFSYADKQYFPTKTIGKESIDSVVYTLYTFEIDTIQKLRLPVFIAKGDSIQPIFAKADSIMLRPLVRGIPSTDSLKATIPLIDIPNQFNYPYWIAGTILLIFIIVLVWGLLGKQIIKGYRLFQFRTRHAIFMQEYNRLVNRITSRKSIEDIERAVMLWKRHLEQIEERPYSSYTTKEITLILPYQNLIESLKSIDRAIYGQEISEQINEAFNVLRSISTLSFEQKREELRNA
jgi:hypothetical protein